MSLVLNKLLKEDIDEKIRLNQEAGVDIFKLRELILDERKDFIWMRIRAEVQIQFYDEQLERINQRIAEGKIYSEPPKEGPSIVAELDPKVDPPPVVEEGLEPIPGTHKVKG